MTIADADFPVSLMRWHVTITSQAESVSSQASSLRDWAIMDASSGGNMLYWGDTTSTTMNVGDVPRFAANAITITED